MSEEQPLNELSAIELEARFIEQDHRLLKALERFLRQRSLYPDKDDPRRGASTRALLWIIFSPLTAGVVLSLSAGLISLLLAAFQLNAALEQNRIAQGSAAASRIEGHVSRLVQIHGQARAFIQQYETRNNVRFDELHSYSNGDNQLEEYIQTNINRESMNPSDQRDIEQIVYEYYDALNSISMAFRDPALKYIPSETLCFIMNRTVGVVETPFRTGYDTVFRHMSDNFSTTGREHDRAMAAFSSSTEPEYTDCKESGVLEAA